MQTLQNCFYLSRMELCLCDSWARLISKLFPQVFFFGFVSFFAVTIKHCRGATERIQTGIITHWDGWCLAKEMKAPQQGDKHPSKTLVPLYRASVISVKWEPRRILKDKTQPSHSLLTLLPSSKRYRSTCCCTTGLLSSFFPQVVRQPLYCKMTMKWTFDPLVCPTWIFYLNFSYSYITVHSPCSARANSSLHGSDSDAYLHTFFIQLSGQSIYDVSKGGSQVM